jgi:membrane-associated phospholipid phosphatase
MREPALVLLFAPRETPDALAAADAPLASSPAGNAPAAGESKSSESAPPAAPGDSKTVQQPAQFPPVEGASFGDVVKHDLRAMPRQIWSGTKYSFGNAQNLAVLAVAFGADRVARNNLDRDIRDEFRTEKGSLAETGDFGSVIGNPTLHVGLALGWYAWAVNERDAKNYAFSKTMTEALVVNALATGLLQVSMDTRAPNDEYWGWPSGHMSSSMCFASVIHEYYGWQAAVPLYLLAGYSGASRLQDREHDFSDLVFGAALGWVVGHSIVKGELPQVAGFTVLPYGGNGVGGVMLMKQW